MAKILLIDDMPTVNAAITSVLRKSGHFVTQASDGTEGLKKFSAEPFDLVITDIMMPNSDGTDVISSIKGTSGQTPIIAISGGGSGVSAEAALTVARQTADLALIKPFENSVLLDAISRLT